MMRENPTIMPAMMRENADDVATMMRIIRMMMGHGAGVCPDRKPEWSRESRGARKHGLDSPRPPGTLAGHVQWRVEA